MRCPHLFAAIAAIALTGSQARAEPVRSYDVPAGPLRAALREFARQSDWQVLFTSTIVAGRVSPGFSGRAASTGVLARVLERTGLTYRIANADTLLIVPAPTLRAAPEASESRPAARARIPASPVASPDPFDLDEIVVTATRLPEPASRIPLSITAETQQVLDQRGARVFADFQGAVPALQMTQSSSGVSNVVLRGVANTNAAATAPTTGFYLDDTPLHKRNDGGFINNNGTPLPPLFDLDRVEILRGPQGTLFGASSEGGTIRYITPQPSLTRSSVYFRSEASVLKDGDPSYDAGLAVGVPIVEGKLGLRASVYDREQGGYIDYIDPYTARERIKNANGLHTRMFRGALAWEPQPGTRVTFSYLSSFEHSDSNVGGFTLPTTSPIVDQTVCYNTTGVTPERPVANPQPVPCTSAGVTFRRVGGTYGPYPGLKPYDLVTANDQTPTKTRIQVPSLTIDHKLGAMSLRSITSYVEDQTRSQQFAGGNDFSQRSIDALYAPTPPSTLFPAGGEFRQGLALFGGLPTAGAQGGPIYGFGYGRNRRHGLSQEVRLSSESEGRPVSFVSGVFYSNMHVSNRWYVLENEDLLSQAFYGLSAAQRYGLGTLVDPVSGLPILYAFHGSSLQDTDLAAFGEANLWVTRRLRLTAGVRASRVTFNFSQEVFGAASGFAAPTPTNGGLSQGRTAETPVTPKFGALYKLADDDMVYLTAAKGYRTGGVNGVLPAAICDPVLARFGLTSAALPPTFKSDQVWSYEAGGKLHLFGGRLQVNGDAYRIDWTNIQTAVNFQGCGAPFITNAGRGRIQGAELEAQARVRDLRIDLSVGYIDAAYTKQTTSPTGSGLSPLVITLRGQPFPVAPWSVSVGARYDVRLAADTNLYVRGDWRWTAPYWLTVFGVPNYSPDSARASGVARTNLRVGVERGGFDLALFAYNLLNNHDGNVVGGRIDCTVAGGPSCASYSMYNPLRTTSWGVPRQVGLQIAYRR